MYQYFLEFKNPQEHQIKISAKILSQGEKTLVQFPKWRPGRYELGNFAKNVSGVKSYNSKGEPLSLKKIDSHLWEVSTPEEEIFTFEYFYYAHEKNAGSSFYGEELIYINGVNCLVYCPGKEDLPAETYIQIPDNFKYAGGLPLENGKIKATSYHEMVDSPFVAASQLTMFSLVVNETPIYIWFQGDAVVDEKRIKDDFKRFSKSCMDLFGTFPAKEYHFINIIWNSPYYHGVEHVTSTVIALGPGHKLMTELYNELLGVSCHEIFHVWNVKTLRPKDISPYDYSSENYSKLHYITEGVTTYYGDLMLLKSEVWDLDTWLSNFNTSVLKRHYSSSGFSYMSLEDASFDSWLYAYQPGVPGRKISFYTKGCIVAFLFDYIIRRETQNKHSLDTVLKELNKDFGESREGYNKMDYKAQLEKTSGIKFDQLFERYIEGLEIVDPLLKEAADYYGLSLMQEPFGSKSMQLYGFSMKSDQSVASVYEKSPAWIAGLQPGDEVIAFNNKKVKRSLDEFLFKHTNENTIALTIFRENRLKTLEIDPKKGVPSTLFFLRRKPNPTESQKENLLAWRKLSIN